MLNVTGYSRLKVGVLSATISVSCLLVFFVFYTFLALSIPTLLLLMSVCVFISVGLTAFFLDKMFLKNLQVITGILNEMDEIVAVKDYQGRFVFCNEKMAELYGSTFESMLGKTDYHFEKYKGQADAFLESLQSIIDKSEIEMVAEVLIDPDTGKVRHLCSTKIPYKDTKNDNKIAIFAKDITEITCLKERIDRDKRCLEHVLDVSDEGLWEWNIHTNQVLHNKRWIEIIGIDTSQETFKEFEACLLLEDREKVTKALELLLTKGQPYNVEFRVKRPDGSIVWVWDRGRIAEYDEDGNPIWLVGIVLDITSKKLNQQKIERLAYYDGLTGLLNRTQLEVKLNKVIGLSHQQDLYSAILFLDLDRFKLLNDSYGHHMGDKLLVMVTERLMAGSKEDVVISRFGGDEFVIIYPLVSSEKEKAMLATKHYANAVMKDISKTFYIKNDHDDILIEYDIAISIGGIVFKDDDISAGSLLQLADLALYRAKSTIEHEALIVDIKMKEELTYSSQLLKEMRQSIVDHDFVIYLQPKVNSNEKIIGAEALVRWQHPRHGLLLPADFMNQAEESNLIVKIGDQVLMQACEQLQRWQKNPTTKSLSMAVNLSAKQIWRSHFVEDFLATINAYDFDKSKLTVEVTETVLLQDINDATDKMNQLKLLGISISLDDFGTGYSSLNYLHRLPIDELKIDRSFIADFIQNKQMGLMVKSIIDLADNFGVKVVAEGVEDQEQFERLKSLNVAVYQGYLFSKPVSLEVFEQNLS